MRIFAISDLHIDYEDNRQWVSRLSKQDYKNDILILAGDISDYMQLIKYAFETLKSCFKEVLFVPGNHDLWVVRDNTYRDSLEKFHAIKHLAKETGIITEPYKVDSLAFVPLTGWYDYSFGGIDDYLKDIWSDFTACSWQIGHDEQRITKLFVEMNKLDNIPTDCEKIISYSHFLPRIDIMPAFIPFSKRDIYGLLGTDSLGNIVKKLKSDIHVYGHSHVNNHVKKDNTEFINNAFGYPREHRITRKTLKCIFEK